MNNLEPGSILHDRYRIIEPLGKGGMGNVYLGLDISLNKKVAIKENFNLSEDSAMQFLQEAHLLAELHHPNLPRVTDYFLTSSFQYLVMDYLSGDDLQKLLEREGRQPIAMVLLWADQLADALEYMHSRKPPVTHRDIKPANIKLRDDGSVSLVDFGIAKAAESSQLTAAGAMGYTPGFAPPEQTGGGRTGPHSDQYAFSATLYTMLTGSRPVESIKRVLSGEMVVPARELNPAIPENVSDALLQAMSITPAGRFKSVKGFIHAIRDPTFRLDEPQMKERRETRPALFLLTLVIIGALILTVLSISALFLYRLAAFVPASVSTQTGTELAQAQQGFTAAPENTLEGGNVVSTVFAASQTPVPVPTRSLISEGRWLAYSSNQADGKTFQIWLMRLGLDKDGNPEPVSTRQLTTGGGNKTHPTWSPDGDFLLYSAPAESGLEKDGLDIWRIPIFGGSAINLTRRKGDDMFASWSPDGMQISFTNNGRDDGIRQLFTMNPDGSDQIRISTAYEESQGIWSPDKQLLLYVITARGNDYFYQRYSTSNYQTPQPYDVAEVFGRLGRVSDPAFSPDGLLLAYTRSKGQDRRIGVADFAARGASFSLITTGGKDYDPAWSSDGKWIAFTSERDGTPRIYIMTSAGLVQTGVSPLTASGTFPSWQP